MRTTPFTLLLGGAAILGCALTNPGAVADAGVEPKLSKLITVDQFGWRPASVKVAILANPEKGQNASEELRPGAEFQVCRASDGKPVFTGKLAPWQDGKLSEAAGDRVWHADFSPLKEPGKYFVLEPKSNLRSYSFRIGDDVYQQLLVDSVRTYYYQRAGTPIPEKFGGKWNHPGGHLDLDAKATLRVKDQDAGGPRNLVGGWYDAGDPNKYVPFLTTTMFNLFTAYEVNPTAFGDATNIPESGNGVPDLLDELKWELDWMLKMQDPDGGLRNRNGDPTYNGGQGAWDSDRQPRFYTAKTTWATAIGAATFAHAARVFKPFEAKLPGYASKLRNAAERAWSYLEAHPNMEPADGTDGAQLAAAGAGSNAGSDRRDRLYAAAELLSTTGAAKYREAFEKLASDTPENRKLTAENGMHPFTGYVDPLNHQSLTQAYLVYARTPGAKPEIAEPFKKAIANTMQSILRETNGADDPYLAYHLLDHYCWGSNQSKGSWGRILIFGELLSVLPESRPKAQSVVEGYAHFIHGRNPLGLCYLSNMGHAGASNCVTRPYHHWFSSAKDKSGKQIDPAPGFLVGGPNKFFSVDWIKPPYGEPHMKAYKDWDAAWNNERQANEASWEITEPAIYYQAAYTLVLAYAMRK